MILSKRATRRLLSTWPQRLAISGIMGFIVWSLMDEELLIFLSITLIAHALLTFYSSKIKEEKPRFNEELKY